MNRISDFVNSSTKLKELLTMSNLKCCVMDVALLDQLYNAVIFVTFIFYTVSWISLAFNNYRQRRQLQRLRRRMSRLVRQ